jgi:hypothetical protein
LAIAFAEEEEADHPSEGAHEADVSENESESGKTSLRVAEVAIDDILVEAEFVGDAVFAGEAFAGGTLG